MEYGKDTAPWKTKETYENLRGAIYGQEAAVRAAVAMDAARRRGEPRNMLFVGPTGCGKTEIFRQLRQVAGSVYVIDAAGLTAEGWKGDFKVKNALGLAIDLEAGRGDGGKCLDDAADAVERGIVVLDEIDKALIPAGGGYTGHVQLQGEMLSMLEGADMVVRTSELGTTVLDTRRMSFAFLGAFQGIYEDRRRSARAPIGFGGGGGGESGPSGVTVDELVAYGMLPELAGRFDRIVTLDGMTEDDYLAAMRTEGSVLDRAMAGKGMGMEFTDDEIRRIAREAAEKGLGLRYIKKQVDRKVDDLVLERAGIPAAGGCP